MRCCIPSSQLQLPLRQGATVAGSSPVRQSQGACSCTMTSLNSLMVAFVLCWQDTHPAGGGRSWGKGTSAGDLHMCSGYPRGGEKGGPHRCPHKR